MEASSRMTSYSSKRETLFPRSRKRLLAIFQLQKSAIFTPKMDLEAFKNSEFENVMSWMSPSMKEVSHTRQWWSKPSTHLSQLLQCLLYLRTYHTIPNISARLPWRAYNKGKPKYSPKVWWNTFDGLHQTVMNIMGKEFAMQKQGFWLGSISSWSPGYVIHLVKPYWQTTTICKLWPTFLKVTHDSRYYFLIGKNFSTNLNGAHGH